VWNLSAVTSSFANIGLSVRDSADINNLGFSSRLDKASIGNSGTAINWEADLENGTTTIYQAHTTVTKSLW